MAMGDRQFGRTNPAQQSQDSGESFLRFGGIFFQPVVSSQIKKIGRTIWPAPLSN